MRKKQGTLLAFAGAVILPLLAPYFWEFVREFFVYEQFSKMLHQIVDETAMDRWERVAPWLAFIGAITLLIGRKGKQTTNSIPPILQTNSVPIVSTPDGRRWFFSHKILDLVTQNLHEQTYTQAQVLEILYEKLASGEWIAKGFRHPIGPRTKERMIPAAHWRIIRFNGDFTEAQGQSFKYCGIAVAKA
jgi:hypothetical protein